MSICSMLAMNVPLGRSMLWTIRPGLRLPQSVRCISLNTGDKRNTVKLATRVGAVETTFNKRKYAHERNSKAASSVWSIFDSGTAVGEESGPNEHNVKSGRVMQNGYSTYPYKDGSKYTGFWKDGLYHGKGKKTYKNGNVYSGFWAEGKRHGKGKLFCKEHSYDGSWENNKEHGRGRQKFDNGDCYDGWFFEGQRSGQGKLTYANGDTLEGTFQDDLIYNGTGVARTKQGTARIGKFVDGALQGVGKIVCRTGMTIEGEFLHGQVCGKCTVRYPTGDVYEGEWANGGRDGAGRLVYADGRVLQGVFRRNAIFTGAGVQRGADGAELEGRWRDGRLVTPAV